MMFGEQETRKSTRGPGKGNYDRSTARNPLDRRRLADGAIRRVPGVGEMTELHHEICRRILMGHKNVDIAKSLKCTPQTVSNVRNSPIVKHRLRELGAARDGVTVNFAVEVQARAQRAFEILDEALMDETGEVPLMMRLKEANNILDRVERVEGIGQRNLHLHAHLTADDIERLKERALSIGLASGAVVGGGCTELDNALSGPDVLDITAETTE